MNVAKQLNASPFIDFSKDEWKRLRDGTPMTLTEDDLERVRGINVNVSMEEVEDIFLPLCRLLSFYVSARQELYRDTSKFLGHRNEKVPFVIGLAGSVAVGKSTTARILRELLSGWDQHKSVAIVTTDGFLFDNKTLAERGLMQRKGFPETYNVSALMSFLSELKAGHSPLNIPLYSHIRYDVMDEPKVIENPDIVIVEGLNVLSSSGLASPRVFVSDYFDFKIFVDADVTDIKQWYIERFLALRDTAFRNPESYFNRYSTLSDEQASAMADGIWTSINEINLMENVLPTRERADLILRKSASHEIDSVKLRKI